MKGLFPWLGSKARLAKTVVGKIEKVERRCYVEIFAGAAHVFFRKRKSKVEVVNDINLEIVNLFRVIQNHLEELIIAK